MDLLEEVTPTGYGWWGLFFCPNTNSVIPFNLISILKRHKRSLSAVSDASGMLGADKVLKRQIQRF